MTDLAPFEPPDPEMVERVARALQRHLAERNKRDNEYEEKAAERLLERLWDQVGKERRHEGF